MERATGFYPVGWGFESLRGRRSDAAQRLVKCGKLASSLYPGVALRRPFCSPPPNNTRYRVKFKKGDTVIYPQHGACIVVGTKKMTAFGETQEYLILKTVINEMTLSVPTSKADEVGVR